MKPKNIFEKRPGMERFGLAIALSLALALVLGVDVDNTYGQSESPNQPSNFATSVDPTAESSRTGHQNALRLVRRVIERLAMGEAFDAKVRQRVWVGGREVIGVGTYEQAGDGSGRFNLQVAMHDGDGKHTLQQISDGRLAWTREQIGEEVSLRRVDVGRLDQWVHGSSLSYDAQDASLRRAGIDEMVVRPSAADGLPPSVRVGGFTEMLEQLSSDYDLRVVAGKLENQEVWILRGSLRSEVREQMLANFPDNQWPELCPTEAVVAIAKLKDDETQFGQGLPIRFEFWASPEAENSPSGQPDAPAVEGTVEASLVSQKTTARIDDTVVTATPSNHLVSLIELYSIRPIASPPIGRFRFENQDMEVNFTNETDRYLSRYGIRITERQSRMLRR